jgi:DNA-directed RNA polymerase subunit RPC12/RpoP
MYEDKDVWPFKCPKCGEEFTEQIGRLKVETTIHCPGQACSMRFKMSPEEFDLALAKAKAASMTPSGTLGPESGKPNSEPGHIV